MTEMKIIEKIVNLVDKLDYKNACIEIETQREKYTIEKEKRRSIGFDICSNKKE